MARAILSRLCLVFVFSGVFFFFFSFLGGGWVGVSVYDTFSHSTRRRFKSRVGGTGEEEVRRRGENLAHVFTI